MERHCVAFAKTPKRIRNGVLSGVGNRNFLMIETGPFSVSQGPMEPSKTSRSERCRKSCFRSFQNMCMYIGKAAKVEMCSSLVSTWWPLNFRCRLSMFEYWKKSSANFWNLDQIYLSQGFGNYFWKPWDKENPKENCEGSTGNLVKCRRKKSMVQLARPDKL